MSQILPLHFKTTGYMKKTVVLFAFLAAILSGCTTKSSKYHYVTVPNDPTNGRIYTLANGLTVYISHYNIEPRIQALIATKAGSKFDPHDATGLAHYLEHMLFKGTEDYGTADYAKEKPLLDNIDSLFEKYRHIPMTDTAGRNAMYAEIDSESYKASHYAIANEYDKLMTAIGAQGTNAFTSVEQTVFQENIPANELEPYLQIESDRFSHPVMRLFHTELEAVYEEKNRHLDNDFSKVDEAEMAMLFKKHPYGTQTTIGTIHDLKNPSLKDIINYFHTYYVPNNMVMALSGDINPDSAIQLVDKYFGGMPSKPVPAFIPPVEAPITAPEYKTVLGPEAAYVTIGYRYPGADSREADTLDLVTQLLSNGHAGLFDIDIKQQFKVLDAYAWNQTMKDYSVLTLQGYPNRGQTLEQVKDTLLKEENKLKTGDFPDWLIGAVVNNLRLQQMQQDRSYQSRAYSFVSAFTSGQDWGCLQDEVNRLAKITKKDVINFARRNFNNNYVVIYKKTGNDTAVEKVQKPRITPIQTNATLASAFLKRIESEKVPEIKPIFLDYKKDISHLTVDGILPVYEVKNNEDSIFDVYYLFKIGNQNSKLLDPALTYLEYGGTSDMTPAQVQQEFYKLGCSYNTFVQKDQLYIYMSGLTQNFVPALKLMEKVLADIQPDTAIMRKVAGVIAKNREDNEQDKYYILFQGMYQYGIYGEHNPFNYTLTNDELTDLKAEEITDLLHHLTSYPHHILYYGPESPALLATQLTQYQKLPKQFDIPPKPSEFIQQKGDNQVYFVDHDMKQAEIIVLEKGGRYKQADAPLSSLYNQYFGGSMASVVFQDLRESKALAYSTWCSYNNPSDTTESCYNLAYIGAQADKLPQALNGMFSLLNDTIPDYSQLWSTSKTEVLKNIETNRIIRQNELFSYEHDQKLGINHDIRQDIYEKVPSLTFEDIQHFHTNKVSGQPYTILVIGNKKDMNIKALAGYGKVNQLTLKNIFGY
jgi:predicted Zn-dependent peptidase